MTLLPKFSLYSMKPTVLCWPCCCCKFVENILRVFTDKDLGIFVLRELYLRAINKVQSNNFSVIKSGQNNFNSHFGLLCPFKLPHSNVKRKKMLIQCWLGKSQLSPHVPPGLNFSIRSLRLEICTNYTNCECPKAREGRNRWVQPEFI